MFDRGYRGKEEKSEECDMSGSGCDLVSGVQ